MLPYINTKGPCCVGILIICFQIIADVVIIIIVVIMRIELIIGTYMNLEVVNYFCLLFMLEPNNDLVIILIS